MDRGRKLSGTTWRRVVGLRCSCVLERSGLFVVTFLQKGRATSRVRTRIRKKVAPTCKTSL